jgi:hypothetical protein
MLREVSDRIAVEEAVQIPDTIPAELAHRYAQQQQQQQGQYRRGDRLANR